MLHGSRLLRWFTLVIVCMLAGTFIVGCGGDGTPQPGDKVTLRYALWQASEQPGYQKSIDEFEKTHPNIKVTIEQNNWQQYWQKLSTEFAGEDAPDVFWDHIAYFPQFVHDGNLMDISEKIQEDHLNLGVYYPRLLDQFKYQDKYYGLPKDWDTIAVFYNKDMFQKAGLGDPSTLTWNPTDGGTFLQAAQKLTTDKAGKHPNEKGFDAGSVSQYGFVSYNSSQELYLNYIAMNGGTFLDKPFGQKFTFNDPKSVQALQFLVDLINKWHVSPPATETNNIDSVAVQLFARGQVAMAQTGSWHMPDFAQQVNFPFGVAQLPAGPQGRVSVFNGLADAIYAKTRHPKEAWELFKWLASAKSQEIVGGGGYVWPAIQSADDLYTSYWHKKNIDVSAFLKEAQGQTVSFPITLGYAEASTKINDTFNQMFLGQIPVQQATDTAVQDGNAALSSS